VQSELPRDIHPTPTAEEKLTLAADQLALALDLYHALRTNHAATADQGFCISAYSLHHAFGLLYGGSTGDAKAQMKAALHYSLDDARQHAALNWQELELAERNLDAVDEPGDHQDPLVVRTLDGVWLADVFGGAVEADYLDLIAVNYGQGVYLADFSSDQTAETERQAINAWISEGTSGLISELFPIAKIDKDTTAVVADALYLEAPWTRPFVEGMTAKHDFSLGDGSEIAVDMMHDAALEARYGQGSHYTALAIPLRGIALEVVFVVPEGKLADFEAGLDPASVTELLDDLSWEVVDAYVPRFELRPKLELTSVFSDQLGMPAPFVEPGAFSGIVPGGVGVLDDVYHDTAIRVDEHGVEVAAATGEVVVATAAVEPSYEFWVDRPFIVMIHDRPTGTVLFLGRVLDPR
jgi:serpin B